MQGVLLGFKTLNELLMGVDGRYRKYHRVLEKTKGVVLGRQKQGPKFGLGKFITSLSFIINEKSCNLLAAKPKTAISANPGHKPRRNMP